MNTDEALAEIQNLYPTRPLTSVTYNLMSKYLEVHAFNCLPERFSGGSIQEAVENAKREKLK